MPDLGKYADAVLGAYAVGLIMIFTLTAQSLWRATRVRKHLREIENRRAKND